MDRREKSHDEQEESSVCLVIASRISLVMHPIEREIIETFFDTEDRTRFK